MNVLPVQPNERIESLDIIRGFALVGIFLVNMPAFQYPLLTADLYSYSYEYTGIDRWIHLFLQLFAEAKFYTIFSFLFGLGFYFFMQRAQEKGVNSKRLYLRRLITLALFGGAHLILLWYGDILLTYAITGFFLLFFYKRKTKTIFIWITVLFVVTMGMLLANLLVPAEYIVEEIKPLQEEGAEKIEASKIMYKDASYLELVAYRWETEVIPVLVNTPYAVIMVLMMFLIGLYAGKIGVFQHVAAHQRLIKLTWIVCLLLAIPLLTMILFINLGIVDYRIPKKLAILPFVTFSGYVLSLFYIASFLLLLQKERWKKVLRPFGFAGRMALTNYLMQTVVGLGIFVGLDRFGQINLVLGILICLIVFPLQIIFSYYWLRKFNYGPMEWVWRKMTYGNLKS